jgi:enamine deaminase RidA (YjgF/YER057c/UK114 family)
MTASPHRVLQPAGWPRPRGYANGVAARGTHIHVAGQVGWDPLTETIVAGGFAAQCAQALANIVAVLETGCAGPHHVVRLTWYVVDVEEYGAATAEVGRTFRSLFGGHYPAMSLVQVAALLEPGARVEIEAVAVLPDDPGATPAAGGSTEAIA